ncbi:Zn(II)2Cys6 transcription factor [Aspergillus homomorphus CBS 101889]|uniref:Putative C6 finger domain protein n=1 Tax=Aspergillus homomorphus (strain CBS 101889) TaxID=1450537 RepID=A0A395HUI1_ASPHC|nr:putative C6 finger domain protein [Aspergillus homomorphus CBS 101889]RAL11592.1 putative C6 finger domain protein [Aspergillus homomorphus CBS 101889]
MASSYPPSQTTMTGYVPGPVSFAEAQSQHQHNSLTAYSILGTNHYPDSVAYWHNPSAQPQPALPAVSYPPVPPKPHSLQQPTPDLKKHKRTRSGCFTCRSRRIKCDETRPICDRCRKGNRDCVYPSPNTPGASKSASARGTSKARGSQARAADGSISPEGSEDVHVLETIADEEEEDGDSVGSSAHLSPTISQRQSAAARPKTTLPRKQSTQSSRRRKRNPSVALDAIPSRTETSTSPSPSTETSSHFESVSARSASLGANPLDPVAGTMTINQLSNDLRFYLRYHCDFITYRHYFLRPSNDRFVRHTILDLALQYEPLLYAVVGFSAYHHCVQTGNGRLYSFLKYYNNALKLLRKSLGSGEPHNEATLATVLVLTTFEEFIGDWVNLIDHHQAAHALMRELLTPETINTNELHQHIFLWYARFDVVAGILAGNETVLSRDWYVAKEEYDAQQAATHPGDVDKQLAWATSINRRFGLDMASLYAKLSRGMIPIDEFMVQNDLLGRTLEQMKSILVQFQNSEFAVQEYPYRVPLTEDDIVDPYVPGGMHCGPLWEVNMVWIDYLSTKAMFKYQSFLALRQTSIAELEDLSMEQCRLMESVDRWPGKENGAIISFKNSLGMAAMFLPKEDKYIMWARRKFASLEQQGYVVASRFRSAMAALWQLPQIDRWWLPNDESYPKIIREVRAMTEERINHPRDHFREDVRDMKALFWNISLDDTESDGSPASVPLTADARPT